MTTRRTRRRRVGASLITALGLTLGVVFTTGTVAGAAAPAIDLSASPGSSIALSGSTTFTATLTGSDATPDGFVAFSVADNTNNYIICPSVVVNATTGFAGTASCLIAASALTDGAGSYTVTAAYSGGQSDNDPGSQTAPLTVQPAPRVAPNVAVAPTSTNVGPGDSPTFTATISGSAGTPTGTVSFTANAATIGSCGSVTVTAGGTAACSFLASSLGGNTNYTIAANYSGDSAYTTGSGTASLTVGQSTPTVSLSGPQSESPSATVAFTATVGGSDGPATGSVTFNQSCGSVPISSGSATCSFTAPSSPGGYSVTATYGGNANYVSGISATSSPTVNLYTPSVNAPDPQTVSSGLVALSATVFGSDPAGSPAGTVTFKTGGTTVCSATVNDQQIAGCSFAPQSLGTGSFQIAAHYGGDSNYAAATSSSSTLTINSYTPTLTITGANVLASATATLGVSISGSGGYPTGTVTIYVDGTQVCSGASLSQGSASGDTYPSSASCQYGVGSLQPGAHTVTASYSGGGIYSAVGVSSSNTATLNIDSYSSSLSLSPTSESVPIQQSNPSYTVKVTASSGQPSGTVSFTAGAITISSCTNLTLTSGAVTCQFSSSVLGSGAFSVKATYAGNSTYASSSATSSLTVGTYGASISLSPGTSQVSLADAASFTATVSGAGGIPTGSATFKSGSSTISGCGSIALSNGSATCAFSAGPLGSGTFQISAVYSGDNLYSSTTSSSSTLTVDSNSVPTTTTSPTSTPVATPVAAEPPAVAIAAIGAVDSSKIPISVSCFTSACSGTITATTRVPTAAGKHKKVTARLVTTHVLTIGTTNYRVGANSTAVEHVQLSKKALSQLTTTKSHRLDVTVTVTVSGGATIIRATSVALPARKKLSISKAAVSSIVASATSLAAGSTTGTTVRVDVRRATGAVDAGVLVHLTDGSGHALLKSSGVESKTNSRGVATFVVFDSHAEQVHFTATVARGKAEVRVGVVTVTFTNAVDVTLSLIEASGTTVPANGKTPANVSVRLRDYTGQPVPGVQVVLRQTSGGTATISPNAAIVTDARGNANFAVATTNAGTVVFAASYVDGAQTLALQKTVTLSFSSVKKPPSSTTTTTTPPNKHKGKGKGKGRSKPKPKAPTIDASRSSVSAGATLTSSVSGTTVTVELKNSAGSPVAGQKVALASSVAAAAAAPAEATTGASGIAVFTVKDSSTTATVAVTYRATDITNSIEVSEGATVTFLPRTAPDAADATITTSSAGNSATITVFVANFSDSPIRGVAVTLHSNSSVKISPSTSTTNSSGLATFTVSGSGAQSVTFEAEAVGPPSIALGSVTVHFQH